MKTLFAFALLLGFLPGAQGQDQQTTEFVKGIQYGISWKIYWDTHLNTWDSEDGDYYEATKAIHQMKGKEVVATIHKKEGPATALDGAFYIAIDSPVPSVQRYMDLVLNFQEGRLAGIDSGSPPESSVLMEKKLTVKLPQDLEELARVPSKSEDVALIREGLKEWVASKKQQRTAQHFFVAPFNELSPNVIIYWKEKKEFIEIGYPALKNTEAINALFKEAKFIDAEENGKQTLSDKQLLEIERRRVFWANRWIANCVNDGVLLEVRP